MTKPTRKQEDLIVCGISLRTTGDSLILAPVIGLACRLRTTDLVYNKLQVQLTIERQLFGADCDRQARTCNGHLAGRYECG